MRAAPSRAASRCRRGLDDPCWHHGATRSQYHFGGQKTAGLDRLSCRAGDRIRGDAEADLSGSTRPNPLSNVKACPNHLSGESRIKLNGCHMSCSGLRLRVTQADQLGDLLALPPPCAVVLELDSMPAREAMEWERKINHRLRTCGCDEATAALFINIGFLSALAWWHWDVISAAPVLSTALGVSCCCLAVAGGKTFGRSRGRRRLAATVDGLRTVLAGPAAA